MSPRRTALWLTFLVGYFALMTFLLVYSFQGQRLDGWTVALILVGGGAYVAAPIWYLQFVVLGDRKLRWRARFREVEPAATRGISIFGLACGLTPWAPWDWLKILGMVVGAAGLGYFFWIVLRNLPLDEPPDEVGDAA